MKNLEINDIVIYRKTNEKCKIIDSFDKERQIEFEDGGTLWVSVDDLFIL